MSPRDPYETLGVRSSASDEEIRAAYRRLVQRHHPDHNAGSPEAARRFEEVQEAYDRVRRLRESGPDPRQAPPGQSPPPPGDPGLDDRLADLERQVRRAQARARKQAERAREQARRAAREAAERVGSDPSGRSDRPSDEELGYVTTEDSFSKILSDARHELSSRFSDAREHPVVRRVSDLIDGLDELASKLDEDRRKRQK